MWLFFSRCFLQVNLFLELLVAAFAITSLSKKNSSGIISECRYQLVHVELSILFTSEWVTNLHILTHSNSRSYASRIHD